MRRCASAGWPTDGVPGDGYKAQITAIKLAGGVQARDGWQRDPRADRTRRGRRHRRVPADVQRHGRLRGRSSRPQARSTQLDDQQVEYDLAFIHDDSGPASRSRARTTRSSSGRAAGCASSRRRAREGRLAEPHRGVGRGGAPDGAAPAARGAARERSVRRGVLVSEAARPYREAEAARGDARVQAVDPVHAGAHARDRRCVARVRRRAAAARSCCSAPATTAARCGCPSWPMRRCSRSIIRRRSATSARARAAARRVTEPLRRRGTSRPARWTSCPTSLEEAGLDRRAPVVHDLGGRDDVSDRRRDRRVAARDPRVERARLAASR